MAAIIYSDEEKRASLISSAMGPTLRVVIVMMMMIFLSYPSVFSGVQGQDNNPSMSLSVTAPTSSDSQFSTWISPLASSLLPPSAVHGAFWGTVAAQDVQTICQLVESGCQAMDATIDAYGTTITQTIQLVATGGCDASNYSPAGVEMVYTDDSGRLTALICDNYAWSIGCAIYVTGDDVENIVNSIQYYGQVVDIDYTFMANYSNKNRKVLQVADGGCRATAIGVGGIAGAYAAATVCPSFGPLAILCAPAAVLIGAFVVGVNGILVCGVMGSAQCFPGEANVLLSSGERKAMFELSIGDKVAVQDSRGNVKFESVYAFGHADGNSVGNFMKIEMNALSSNSHTFGKVLNISPLHFCVVVQGGKVEFRRSKEINVGDVMLILNNDNVLQQAQVTRISMMLMQGLYNPFTMGGTIIVDGVVASTHSEWFLDATLDYLHLTPWIPLVYQVLLFPIRILYVILGRNTYTNLYEHVERTWNIHQIGYHHGKLLTTSI